MKKRVIEEPRKNLTPSDDRARGHDASAEGFGQAHEIGRDAIMFAAKHLAGAPHAGLHFIEDEERAELVAERAHARQIIVVGNVYAALALDRLQKNRAHVLADCTAGRHHVAQREKIVEGHVFDVRKHRPKRTTKLRFSACGERTVALAVKAFSRRNDRLFCGIEGSREFERAFHGFRSAIAEEAEVQPRGHEHRQRLREHGAKRIEQVLAM